MVLAIEPEAMERVNSDPCQAWWRPAKESRQLERIELVARVVAAGVIDPWVVVYNGPDGVLVGVGDIGRHLGDDTVVEVFVEMRSPDVIALSIGERGVTLVVARCIRIVVDVVLNSRLHGLRQADRKRGRGQRSVRIVRDHCVVSFGGDQSQFELLSHMDVELRADES